MNVTMLIHNVVKSVETGSKLRLDGMLMNEWTFEESYIDNEVSDIFYVNCLSISINAQHCACVATSGLCTTPVSFSEVNFNDIINSLEPLHLVDYNDWQKFVNKM